MEQFLAFTMIGLVTGALYAVAASGLVVTYTTSGIFNFAHGALGMLAAYVYWQLRVGWGWPTPVALIVVLVVLAPAFGALIERVIMRGLGDVSEVTKLVVSVSLLFGVYQLALIWFPANVGRKLSGFYEGNFISLGFYDLPWHEAIILAAAVLTAVGLRFGLYRTRSGVAMRGVVDDRDLTRLNGNRPNRTSMASWAVGTALAALAGILLAGSQGSLVHISLTLLVINAYGAAMFGRLRSLPATFAGAVVLGLAQSYAVGYVDLGEPFHSLGPIRFAPPLSLTGLRAAIPVIALFAVLLFLPALRLRPGAAVTSREIIPSPPMRRWLAATVVLGVGAFAFATAFPGLRTFQVGQGLALGIVMLSLVPLTGYAGQISLAPMAFAGIGAVAMGHWGRNGEPLALLASVAVTALVGALVALPAIRLRGLYLALATAAFAVLTDQLFFSQNTFLPSGSLDVARLDAFGWSFTDDRAHLVLLAVVFGVIGTGLAGLRAHRLGRRLVAMKSSEAACAMLGVSLAATKLWVFTLSAAIAGLGGALYAAQLGTVGPTTFQFLQSLPIVLLAVVGGIAAIGGALFGGLAYALMYFIIPDLAPALTTWLALGPALAGVSLGRNPNGAVIQAVTDTRAAIARLRQRGTDTAELDWMGLDGFDAADRRFLDASLALDTEPAYLALAAVGGPTGSDGGAASITTSSGTAHARGGVHR